MASVTLSDWLGVRAPKEHGSSYQHHAWSIYSAWQSLGISDLLSKGQRSRSQGYRVCCQRRSTARHDCINIMFCFSLAACGDISVESHVRTCTRHGVTIVAPCGSMDRLSEDTRYIRGTPRQAGRQAGMVLELVAWLCSHATVSHLCCCRLCLPACLPALAYHVHVYLQ